jgi:nitrogen fixation protein FixH
MRLLSRGSWWPIGITAILGGTVALNVWVMRLANADPSMVVEANYYAKGIHWDDEMAQARRNVTLGWSVEPSLAPVGPSQRAELRVAVRDANGAALTDARVTLEAFAVARSASMFDETLARDGDAYHTTLPVTTTGQWELRFTVVRGDQRFTAVKRVDAVRLAVAPTAG